jgi:hypothetical protein
MPQEENALVEYLLQACKNVYPLPVKAVRAWMMFALKLKLATGLREASPGSQVHESQGA